MAREAGDKTICSECGSEDVQILMPAWVDPDTLKVQEVDAEAEPLSTWCQVCEGHTELIASKDWVEMSTGWGASASTASRIFSIPALIRPRKPS